MDDKMKMAVNEIIPLLNKQMERKFNTLLGFDACVDKIVRVIQKKDPEKQDIYFESSRDFGEFLAGREGMGCGIELRQKVAKIGGNMVNTAHSFGMLGISSECIGTFGWPGIHPVFRQMSSNCHLHTVGETIITHALEFSDSKIMMADLGPYEKLSWESIKRILGMESIKGFFRGKDLVALLNWSEIEQTSQIWNGILEDVLPTLLPEKNKPLFLTDLSDCTRKSADEIRKALKLLGEFRRYFKVIFSMNRNEAGLIASAFELDPGQLDPLFMKKLHAVLQVDELVLHLRDRSSAYDGTQYEDCPAFRIQHPAVLTGGGDNFNAGYSFSRLNGFSIFNSLLIANAVAGSYIQTGNSPGLKDLTGFLENQLV